MSTIRFATLRAFGPELAEAIVAQRAPGAAPPRDVSIEDLRSLPASLSPKAKHRLAVLLGTLTKATQQPKAEPSGGAQSPLQTRIAAMTAVAKQPDANAASVPIAYSAAATGRIERSLKEPVVDLAVFPDGRSVTVEKNGAATIWDADGSSIATVPGKAAQVTALSDGGIAVAFHDNVVRIFDEQGRLVVSLLGHEDRVTGMGELPGGRLVTASADGTIRVWDKDHVCVLTHCPDGGRPIEKIAVLQDGNIAFRVGTRTRICDPTGAQKHELANLRGDHYASFKGLADGNFLAAKAAGGAAILDGSGKQVGTFVPLDADVSSMIELPGAKLATGGPDGVIRVWDGAGQRINTLKGHTSGISGLACLADGRLVSSSFDGTVRIWSFVP